jgi:hypothetical protein
MIVKLGISIGVLLLVFALALFVPVQSLAQEEAPRSGDDIHRSIPPQGAKTHTVTIGERYKAGWFKRWIMGSDYRDVWAAPVEVTVLDFDTTAGGLKAVGTGGFGQTVSLHLKGENGRPYSVRSIDKDPTKRMPAEFINTAIADIVQDLISAQLPTAGLVVDPLLEATGILYAPHTLVAIPDHPGLGEYRERFAGIIGMFQEYPLEGDDGAPGFAGSYEVSSTKSLWEELRTGPCQRVAAREFLKARLVDFVVNDKDRHSGQWRWARFPEGDCYVWRPIPEDRDQAFVDLDGLAMAVARRSIPKQIKFEDKYPSLIGLSINGWEIDRQFLAELEWPVWDSIVTAVQNDLTDSVIENAVRRLPPPHYALVGEYITQALKSRRDLLPGFVERYYRLITRDAEVTATDRDEFVELEHRTDGNLDVRIGVLDDAGNRSNPPYFHRTYRPEITREVRFYLHGGDDHVEVLGEDAHIRLRIDGGDGDDVFRNRSTAGAGDTRFYDSEGDNRFEKGNGARIDTRPFERPPGPMSTNARYALDWGKQGFYHPLVSYDPDLGVFVGMGGGWQYFGYRKVPYASRHSITVGLAIEDAEPLAEYTGVFRHIGPGIDGRIHVEYSGINVIRFYGFGNGTKSPGDEEFYEIEQEELILAPGIELRTGRNRGTEHGVGKEALRSELTIRVGPIVKYARTPLDDNEDKFIATFEPPLYGTESFVQAGAQGMIRYDTRDNPGHAKRGVMIEASGAVYPDIGDVESAFAQVNGAATAYLTAPIPTKPTLALRAGGKKLWGTFPFHEAAFLGGRSNLRGFRMERFAGEASVFGNAELRLSLFPVQILLPGHVGVFGAADAGRVYLADDPADADEWHTALGGGLWISFLNRKQTLSVAVMDGDDLTGVYARAGFSF